MGIVGLETTHQSFVPPAEDFTPFGARDVVISVSYEGFTEEAQMAFQYAVDIWASELDSDVPILVEAVWEDLPGNTLGFAGASGFWQGFNNAPSDDLIYPSPLADKLAGEDLDPGNPDIIASFDSGTSWYFGLDGNPGPDEFDFVTVVLHELCHGLGMVGTATIDDGEGVFINPIIAVYDEFVSNGNGVPISNFANDGQEMANQLTGEDLFWNGGFAVANNQETEPTLFAPNNWTPGSSYSHVDETTYQPGSGNSLMTPFINQGEAVHNPGNIVRGMLDDMGWSDEPFVGCELNEFTLTYTPDCYGLDISINILNENGVPVYFENDFNFEDPPSTVIEQFCLPDGCYTINVYDTELNGWGGGPGCEFQGSLTLTNADGQVLVNMDNPNFGSEYIGEFCSGDAIIGCMEAEACNYNPEAEIEGYCEEPGCDDPEAYNFSTTASCYDNDYCVYWDPQDVYMYIEPDYVIPGPLNGEELTNYIVYRVYIHIGQGNYIRALHSYEDDAIVGGLLDIDVAIDAPCGCFHSPLGAFVSETLSCELFEFFPEVQFDTYLTIGDVTSCNQGMNFEVFAADPPGTDIPMDFCTTPLVGFRLSSYGENLNGLADENGDVMLAQITTCDQVTFSSCVDISVGDSQPFNVQVMCFEETYIPVFDCGDPLASNYNPETLIDDGSCVYDVTGCTDPEACNYDATAEVDDGSCDYTCFGCLDPEACNYSADATIDDGSCNYDCYGCTDSEACNYSADATIDDGSCDYDCYGCTDQTAINFDPEATLDDGSCFYECLFLEYTPLIEDCGGDDDEWQLSIEVTALGNVGPYTLQNSINADTETVEAVGTVVVGTFTEGEFVDLTFTSQPYASCTLLDADYACPNSIADLDDSDFRMYPNPATNEVIIESVGMAISRIEINELSGRKVYSEQLLHVKEQVRIDLSALAEGMYIVSVFGEEEVSSAPIIVRR